MKILLVDDHKVIRETLASYLRDILNVEVHEASNGYEALLKLDTTTFTIIICDIHMPRMGGIELITSIRKKDKEVKIITLTMLEDTIYVKNSLLAGSHGYVLKEGDTAPLVKAIESIMNGKYFYSDTIKKLILELSETADLNKYNKNETKRIVEMILSGLSLTDIGNRLNIDQKTMKENIDIIFSRDIKNKIVKK